jgi:PAS domain S-box-containing protein
VYEGVHEAVMDRDRFFLLSPDLLATAGPDGHFHDLNPAWMRCLGWTLDELRTRPWIEFVHPDDVATTSALRDRPPTGGAAAEIRIENRWRHKDGSYRWIAWHAAPMVDGTASLIGRDITDAKRAERERQRLIDIIEATSDLVAICDAGGRVLYYNRAGRQMLGIAEDEDVSCISALDHAPKAVREMVPQTIGPTIREGLWSGETVVVARDGREIPVSAVILVHKTPRGRVEAFSTIARDITERKQLEAALHAQSEQLRQEAEVTAALARVGSELISSLDAPVVLERLCRLATEVLPCDAAGAFLLDPGEQAYVPVAGHGAALEAWEALRLTKFPLSVFGRLHERLDRETCVQFAASDAQGRLARALFKAGGSRVVLFVALRRGGEVFGVLSAAHYARSDPFSAQQQRIARGMAQLASLALENARLVEELERANRFRSDFIATMSHELRTPMTVVLGYHELLLDGAFGPLNPEQTDTLERAQLSAQGLLDLVSATLDLSRLEARRVPLTLQEVPVTRVLEDLQRETPAPRGKPNLRLAFVRPGDPLTLRTDPIKLRMVLKNLVGNALKFTERGEISVSAQARDGGVEFTVRDTGIGIPPDAHALIFEPFRQLEAPTPQVTSGAGLGLYIVRRVLDLLGGRIAVDSSVGVGSTFRVWLPMQAPQASDPNEGRAPSR